MLVYVLCPRQSTDVFTMSLQAVALVTLRVSKLQEVLAFVSSVSIMAQRKTLC